MSNPYGTRLPICGACRRTRQSYQCYRDEVRLPLLQIHDELVFELPTGIADGLARAVHIARTAVPLVLPNGTVMPFDSSSDMAETWGEVK